MIARIFQRYPLKNPRDLSGAAKEKRMAQRLVVVSYPVDDGLRRLNAETLDGDASVVCTHDVGDGERLHALRRADALIAWQLAKEFPAGTLREAQRLRFAQLLSAGADTVDFSALPDKLVVASNTGAYARPMAEHVMAMTLSLAKHLPQRHAAMAQGRFDQGPPALSMDGAVCAILGFGGIGIATARLMRAFGTRVYALNRTGQTTEPVDFAGTLADLGDVLPVADVVVISLPLTKVTRGLIGARELSAMKPAAVLVNVARGAIVDETALYQHLRAHPEFSAGIDTWWHEPTGDEPFRPGHPFFELPNLIGSPHNSSLVPGTVPAAARAAAENVRRYLRGENVTGLVRRSDYVT
jgi:phosphoglycerate dehydrogenase-like enzyme